MTIQSCDYLFVSTSRNTFSRENQSHILVSQIRYTLHWAMYLVNEVNHDWYTFTSVISFPSCQKLKLIAGGQQKLKHLPSCLSADKWRTIGYPGGGAWVFFKFVQQIVQILKGCSHHTWQKYGKCFLVWVCVKRLFPNLGANRWNVSCPRGEKISCLVLEWKK